MPTENIEAAIRELQASARRVLDLLRAGELLTEEQYRIIRQIAAQLLSAVQDWEGT